MGRFVFVSRGLLRDISDRKTNISDAQAEICRCGDRGFERMRDAGAEAMGRCAGAWFVPGDCKNGSLRGGVIGVRSDSSSQSTALPHAADFFIFSSLAGVNKAEEVGRQY